MVNRVEIPVHKGPDHLLEGNGKVSRYVEIKELAEADSGALKALIRAAFEAYKAKNGK